MTNRPDLRVLFPPYFLKRIKSLRKKYPNVWNDIQPIVDELENGNTPGEQVKGTNNTVYKVRLRNTDARRGKSGGYRLLYYLRTRYRIFMVEIYSKSDQSDIGADTIRRMIDEIPDND